MGKRKHAEASPAAGDAGTAAEPQTAEKSSKKAKKAKQQQAEEQPVAAAPAPAGASAEKKKKKKDKQQQQQEDEQPAAAAVKKEKKRDAEQQQQQQQPPAAGTPSTKEKKKKDKQKQLQLPPGLPVHQLIAKAPAAAAVADAADAAASHISIAVEVLRDPIVNEKQLLKEARRSKAAAAGKSSSSSSGAAGLSNAEAAAVQARAAQLQRGVGPFVFALGAAGLGEADEQQLGFQAYAADPAKESHPMYLVSRLPGANLIATTEMPVQSATDKAHYVVGIRNKRTGQLRLAEAAGGSLLRLEAQAAAVNDADVAGVVRAAQQQQRGPQPDDVAARRLMARRLVEAFGSTRRKRQMKQREEGAVVAARNADTERLGLLLGEVAARATAAGETRAEVMGKLGLHRNIPAHNPAATQPHLAYKVSAMFPDTLLAAINSGQILHAAEKQEDRQRLAEKKQVPAYVLSRLQRVSDEADPRKRRRLAKLLALLAALLQLAGARSRLPLKPPRAAKEEGGAARPGGLTELSWQLGLRRLEVLEPLLDAFYNKTTAEEGGTVYVREDAKRQLLLMHVLVVALDAEGWALAPPQFEALRQELKMSAADVVARFRELGCICKAAKLPAGIAPDGTPSAALASYSIALLPGGPSNTKTLEQSFPKAKTGAKQQRGGR